MGTKTFLLDNNGDKCILLVPSRRREKSLMQIKSCYLSMSHSGHMFFFHTQLFLCLPFVKVKCAIDGIQSGSLSHHYYICTYLHFIMPRQFLTCDCRNTPNGVNYLLIVHRISPYELTDMVFISG